MPLASCSCSVTALRGRALSEASTPVAGAVAVSSFDEAKLTGEYVKL